MRSARSNMIVRKIRKFESPMKTVELQGHNHGVESAALLILYMNFYVLYVNL